MCLAVPAKVEKLDGKYALVALQGSRLRVAISLVPDVKPGDHVLVHAGYAITVVDEAEARETLKLLEELYADGAAEV